MHLVDAAKNLTCKSLGLEDCPTETEIIIDKKILKKFRLKKTNNAEKKIFLKNLKSGTLINNLVLLNVMRNLCLG